MSSRKKKRSYPFHRKRKGQKKSKNTFDKEWAAKLVESDKGSFYNQEKLLDELDCNHEAGEHGEMSASRHKIQLQETVEAEEMDEEKWKKLKCRSIFSACHVLSRRWKYYGRCAIAKWTWFIVDYTMPK